MKDDNEPLDTGLTGEVLDDNGDAIDADHLALLTPEERAAILDEEGDGEEGDDDQDGEGDEEDDDAGEGKGDDADAPEEGETPADPPAPADAPADAKFPDTDPEELKAANTALKGEMKAAREKFDDGEMTSDEFDAEIDRITQATAKNLSAIEKAEGEQEAYQAQWVGSVQAWAKDHPDLFADQAHVTGYDAEVRRITADPSFDHLSHKAKLDLGLKNYANAMEAKGKPLPEAWLAQKKAPKPRRDPLKSDLGEVPKTLARAPAAQLPADTDSRFGQLAEMIENGTLSGRDLEKAMANMSEAEREAFASMDV